MGSEEVQGAVELPTPQKLLREMIMSGQLTVGQVVHELKRGIDHYCANAQQISTYNMWIQLEQDESQELVECGKIEASAEIVEQVTDSFKDLKVNQLDEKAKESDEEDDGFIP